jgi:hypothetical protein
MECEATAITPCDAFYNGMTLNIVKYHINVVNKAIFDVESKMLFCDADGQRQQQLEKYMELRDYIQKIYNKLNSD